MITWILLAAVVLLLYLLRRELYARRGAQAHAAHLAQEGAAYRERLREISTVIESSAGGIKKRIDEHVEIENAIRVDAPDLLAAAPGFRYWLDANKQFFTELHVVSRGELDKVQA